ncbi:hypothetical protein WA026_001824 [Henosepilachna vigintioctopunctata]|uniref:Uncharacterized protein n=1 Tax=Henosepilachna vigintioctopunctata TaxID=420089 RepID=A0AAW1UUL1_9CUCU
MAKFLFALFLVTFVASYECAEVCQKCKDSNSDSNCRYGGFYHDEDCPDGRKTCYRMSYTLNGEKVYQRGCDNDNFCNSQRQRSDIEVHQCDQCTNYFCNTGTLM